MITQEKLKYLFSYKDGYLIRNVSTSNIVKVGDKVGSYDKGGYLITRIDGKSYKVHRLIWMYFYGEFPNGMIDHINHKRDDNRIDNLRVVNSSENCKNKSNIKGYYYSKQNKKYIAECVVDYKYKYLGQYDTEREAKQAYLDGIKKYGFHENHGKVKV